MSQFIEMFYNEKYPLQKLKTHIDVIRGVSYKPVDIKEETSDSISVILRSNNISNGQINFDDVVYVDNKRVTTEQVLSKGDIVMCGSNGSKKLVGKAAMINTIPSYRTSFGAFCLGIRCKESILPEYLSVYFQTSKYREVIEFLGSGSNILNIKPEHIYNLEIPIPSLEDQKHFVTIAEQADKSGFDGRKSQFIEMFGDNKQIEKQGVLADFCALKAGKSVKSGDISDSYEEGLYPCYGGNGLRGYVSSYSHDGIYNIIGRQGALCGNVNIVNGKFYATEHAVVVTPKEQIAPYWLYFALSGMNLNQYARGVAQPGLAVNQLERLPFAIPSIDLQQRFVTIAEQADKSGSVLLKLSSR